MKTRRLAAVAATIVLVTTGAAGAGSAAQSPDSNPSSGPPAELQEMSLRLDWTWLGYHMPFEYARQQGYYEDVGIDLEIGEGQGSGTTVKLIGTGDDDFGFADSSALVQGIAAGADIRNVALIWQQANFAIVCDPAANVRVPADLEGKSVLLIPSENVAAVWPVFLEKSEVDATEVTVVNADYSNKQSLFVAKQADCMAGVDGQDILLVRYARPEITDDDVLRWADYGVNAPGHGIIVSNELIESQPELVAGFVEASIRGWREICADPQLGIDLYLEMFPTLADSDRQFAVDNLPYECDKTIPPDGQTGEPFGPTDIAIWQGIIDAQIEYAGLEDAPAAEDVFTNEFVGG